MSVLKKLFKETFSYGFSTILGRMLNFLLVFVHTKAFLPEELSVNVELYSYMAIANILYTYGFETAYFRFAKEDESKYYRLIMSSIIGTSFILTLILWFGADAIMLQLGYPSQGKYLKWLSLILAIDAITAIPFAKWRLEQKVKAFVLAKLINIMLFVGLNVLFFLYLKPLHEGMIQGPDWLKNWYQPSLGVGYIFLFNLLANATLFFWLWKPMQAYRWYWNWGEWKKLWVYAYPLTIMSLAAMFNLTFDRLLLKHWLPIGFYQAFSSEAALGIYGNCLKLSVFMSLVIQSFKYAAEPFFLHRNQGQEAKANLALVTHWFVIACTLLWVVLSSNLFWIKTIFLRNPIYWKGIDVVPYLLLGNLFLGVYYTISVWIKTKDKTHYGTLITLAGFGLTVLGNYLLIPLYGFMGCAYAFAFSSFGMMLLCYLLGQGIDPSPYRWKAALAYMIMGGLAIGLGPMLAPLGLPALLSQNLGPLIFMAYLFVQEFYLKRLKLQ